jgi:ketosteroid isomerase-like protein
VLVREGLWVVEGTLDYRVGREVDFVFILELRDGKVFRETRSYADPFKASDARARWFERMER